MSVSIISLLTLGFVLGLKHALDADHLAAVSVIASEQRSLFRSSLIGAFWGLGHTLALVVAGMLVILLRLEISVQLSKAFELCVGLMLILLGVNALKKLFEARRIHIHAHEHDGHWHIHPHLHERNDQNEPHTHHGLRLGARPFLIGLVHGLAGSGALTLLVVATIPSAAVGVLYLLIFGIGAVGGMMMMSTIFALPAKLTAARFVRANFALRGFAGVVSVALGCLMIYELGFENHLLR